MLNAFTIDVEDYYQVSAFERDVPRESWGEWPSRVVTNTQRLLALLRDYDVHGTFFVLGWVAERFPDLVREIDEAGHEVATHGYEHRLIYEQTPEAFRDDLARSLALLRPLVSQPVRMYRAPSFSVTTASQWALDIMAEQGIEVDSSIYPIHHDRYGIPGARPEIHRISTPHGTLCEFPPTVVRVGRMNLPTGGGGYFRLFPWWLTQRLLRKVNRQSRPFMFYLHPWEVDPDQPRVPTRSRRSRFRHYVNLRTCERKLRRLLETFSLGTISDVLAEQRMSLESAGPTSPIARG